MDDRRSTSSYSTFLGGNLVSLRSKKQSVVARSTAEAEFRAMAHGVSELLWLQILLTELRLFKNKPLMLYYDNKAAIDIASNQVHHDRKNILRSIVTLLKRIGWGSNLSTLCKIS